VSVADRVFVAIEAGALVRTFDGGRTWRDRVRGGPYDTHTAGDATTCAPADLLGPPAMGTMKAPMLRTRGVRQRMIEATATLVGVAVDPADPDTVIVSATDGPGSPIRREGAEAFVYRKTGVQRWEQSMSGLPGAKGIDGEPFCHSMLANQPPSTPPTTAASSDQVMQDGTGRL